MKKTACIIAATKLEGSVLLLKNRDRTYKPDIVFLHAKVDGTEVCVVFDKVTKFCEGMNEHGIGIVNATMKGQIDEKEGQKKSKEKGPKTTDNGRKILKALSYKDIEEVVKSLKTYMTGLEGHTLVADKDQIYSIESTKDHETKVTLLDTNKVNVRTNHGVYYPDAGYQDGDNYVSSIVRRWEAQKRIQDLSKKKEFAKALVKPIHDEDSPFNLVKNTDSMHTTSQLVMDLNKKEMWLYVFPKNVDFSGTVSKLDTKPKIKTKLFKYPGR